MSRLYYFASDNVLEEQPNPYVKMVSVNQAIKMGMDIDLDLIGEDLDRDEPDVILFFEDEEKLKYPNIFVMDKEDYYYDIGTTKQYCATLEWNYSDDTVGVVLNYIQNQMKNVLELELWSIWLGSEGVTADIEKIECKLRDLTADLLKRFLEGQSDFQCMTIVR